MSDESKIVFSTGSAAAKTAIENALKQVNISFTVNENQFTVTSFALVLVPCRSVNDAFELQTHFEGVGLGALFHGKMHEAPHPSGFRIEYDEVGLLIAPTRNEVRAVDLDQF